MKPLLDCKIIVEIHCPECDGTGLYKQIQKDYRCSECDGTGHYQMRITLLSLKNLLEGGQL